MKQIIAMFVLLLPLAILPASAQEAEEAADLYQVEVIVFRHVDQSRTTSELPRIVEPQIADVLDQQLPRLGPGLASPSSTDSLQRQPPFWSPAAGKRFMDGDLRRLERLQAYEVIDHLAWVQPAADVSIAEGVDSSALGAPASVNGSLKLYRKRYLHLALNLSFDEAGSRGGLQSYLQTETASPAIVDSRRMRLGRMVYFDQPRFGVLAVVNKLDDS